MLGLLKLMLGLGFLGLIFGFGYLWGSQKSDSIQTTLNIMRTELTSKIEVLEQGLRRTRIRMELMNARNHLVRTQTAIQSRNFGEAKTELENARTVILRVAETADPSQQKELHSLASLVEGIQKQIHRPNTRAKQRVEEAIRALDNVLS
jgi:hypothetical protein